MHLPTVPARTWSPGSPPEQQEWSWILTSGLEAEKFKRVTVGEAKRNNGETEKCLVSNLVTSLSVRTSFGPAFFACLVYKGQRFSDLVMESTSSLIFLLLLLSFMFYQTEEQKLHASQQVKNPQNI